VKLVVADWREPIEFLDQVDLLKRVATVRNDDLEEVVLRLLRMSKVLVDPIDCHSSWHLCVCWKWLLAKRIS
jgi:hypothetical protein